MQISLDKFDIDGIKLAIKNIKHKAVVGQFKSNHSARLEFYSLLEGYLNSPGQIAPVNFFGWYLEQLDKEEKKAPHLILFIRKKTKNRNEPGLRAILNHCLDQVKNHSADFAKSLQGLLPDDEERILTASIKSDIRGQLQSAMQLCQEKIDAADMIRKAVSSNAVLFFVITIAHYVIYDSLYEAFITSPAIIEPSYDQSRLSEIDSAYLTYHWFSLPTSWAIIGMILLSIFFTFKYLIKNWTSKGMFFREQYVDFLPPFSISKLYSQYSFIMVTNAFMKIGYGFYDAVSECKKGASQYEVYQIDKILNNKTDQSHKAFNTFYMGTFGNMIESRSENIQFDKALSALLPSIKKKRDEMFMRIISISLLLTIKPLLWGSVFMALMPIIGHMVDIISELQNATSSM